MNRKFLEDLGLDKLTVIEIMAQHEEDIQKIDSEVLQTRITELETQQEADKIAYEANLKDAHLSSALKIAMFQKVHDVDMTLGFIDKSAIEVDQDGKVISGLDEQIASLQESKAFLFVPEKEEKKPVITGVIPVDSGVQREVPINIGAEFAKQANERTKLDTSIWR